MTTKPGWQTTEFWTTLVVNVVAILSLTGAIGAEDREPIQAAATNVVSGVVLAVTSAAYIWSRARAKS